MRIENAIVANTTTAERSDPRNRKSTPKITMTEMSARLRRSDICRRICLLSSQSRMKCVLGGFRSSTAARRSFTLSAGRTELAPISFVTRISTAGRELTR